MALGRQGRKVRLPSVIDEVYHLTQAVIYLWIEGDGESYDAEGSVITSNS